MNKKIIIILACFFLPRLAVANIATAIAEGTEPLPATEDAKKEGVLPEDAVTQLISGGVDTVMAVEIVQTVYGLSSDCGLTQEVAIAQMTESGVPQDLATNAVQNRCGEGDCESTVAPIDNVVIAALNILPEGADAAPVAAMFSGCEIAGLDSPELTPGIASSSSGGGGTVSPN